MASITLSKLKKNYQTLRILNGVSLEILDGEFIALVGPSGCGKSTLLRMVAGLEEVTEGDILLGDTRINDVSPKDRNVAMVFQNYALYPHMTVRGNLGFALKLQRQSKQHIEARIHDAAAILGLLPLLERRPAQLSGGQRQRVAMGRAIVRQPQAFLFDEPLSNLDAKLRVQMRTEIKALHQRLRTTTLYVTHDQIEAMTMADRIVVMRDGQIEQVGSPLEVYENPVNAFVAQFIGSPAMNLINATVQRSGSSTRLVSEAGDALALAVPAALEHGRRIQLGIRPEHLEIHLGEQRGTLLAAQVLVVEPTGAETQVVAQWSSQRLTSVTRERFTAQPHTAIGLHVQPEHMYFFDAETGLRIGGEVGHTQAPAEHAEHALRKTA